MVNNIDITKLSLYQLSQAIQQGQLSSVEIVTALLERIEEKESQIHAWEYLDHDYVLDCAKKMDDLPIKGPLHGLPIGVKDTIDTIDFPTERGSPIYKGKTTPWDAACVALLKQSGAIIMGKTVTTEFAYFRPGKTANPHNIKHTPGGSSSGSAAAVADFMVPAALGTQTAGSLIRPASYCGVIAYKPTLGDFTLSGVRPVSHSLDTLGVITRTVEDVNMLRAVLLNQRFRPLESSKLPPRIAFCHTPDWLSADAYTRAHLESTAEFLSSGNTQISTVQLPSICDQIVSAQKIVMAYEAAQHMCYEYNNHREALSPQIIELIEDGLSTDRDAYTDALSTVYKAREEINSFFEKWDVILAPAAPGEAPIGLEATGDPIFSRLWTMLGLPCITLPAFNGVNNLPIGIQLIGAYGEDEHLLRIAQWVEQKLANNH